MLEAGFDLQLEPGLAQDGIFVSLGGGFEKGALIIPGLPDGFYFIEAIEPGQVEGIALVVFVGVRTDEPIVPGVTDGQLLDVRPQQLADPAGEIGFFQDQAFVGGADQADVFDELIGASGKPPPLALTTGVIEVAEHTILRVGIQAQPCYGICVSHNQCCDGLLLMS